MLQNAGEKVWINAWRKDRSVRFASYALDRVGFARSLWWREWNAAPRVGFRKGDRGFEIFANEWFSWTGDLSAISHGKGNKSRHTSTRLTDCESWQDSKSLDTRRHVRWIFASVSSCTHNRRTLESTKEEGEHRANWNLINLLKHKLPQRARLRKFRGESRELKRAERPENRSSWQTNSQQTASASQNVSLRAGIHDWGQAWPIRHTRSTLCANIRDTRVGSLDVWWEMLDNHLARTDEAVSRI